ncbi:unnamed protein product [Cercopithifilaria johnstoni]|uniref:Uncharacterized protein n=1 Tax=Cercopithifilaria johnstoni TaxID=2874296 RepID=A0A8J2M403_9BILA|nr:unnamed protein product [Cercopithifilaria johnstoni]
MQILLFACTAAMLFAQGSGLLMVQPSKLGQTLQLELGAEVMNVQAAIPEAGERQKDRMDIVKNGAITNYGRERYGDRLSFRNGTLTIDDITETDAVSYFYHLHNDPKKPAAIDVIIQ